MVRREQRPRDTEEASDEARVTADGKFVTHPCGQGLCSTPISEAPEVPAPDSDAASLAPSQIGDQLAVEAENSIFDPVATVKARLGSDDFKSPKTAKAYDSSDDSDDSDDSHFFVMEKPFKEEPIKKEPVKVDMEKPVKEELTKKEPVKEDRIGIARTYTPNTEANAKQEEPAEGPQSNPPAVETIMKHEAESASRAEDPGYTPYYDPHTPVIGGYEEPPLAYIPRMAAADARKIPARDLKTAEANMEDSGKAGDEISAVKIDSSSAQEVDVQHMAVGGQTAAVSTTINPIARTYGQNVETPAAPALRTYDERMETPPAQAETAPAESAQNAVAGGDNDKVEATPGEGVQYGVQRFIPHKSAEQMDADEESAEERDDNKVPAEAQDADEESAEERDDDKAPAEAQEPAQEQQDVDLSPVEQLDNNQDNEGTVEVGDREHDSGNAKMKPVAQHHHHHHRHNLKAMRHKRRVVDSASESQGITTSHKHVEFFRQESHLRKHYQSHHHARAHHKAHQHAHHAKHVHSAVGQLDAAVDEDDIKSQQVNSLKQEQANAKKDRIHKAQQEQDAVAAAKRKADAVKERVKKAQQEQHAIAVAKMKADAVRERVKKAQQEQHALAAAKRKDGAVDNNAAADSKLPPGIAIAKAPLKKTEDVKVQLDADHAKVQTTTQPLSNDFNVLNGRRLPAGIAIAPHV
jgi:hypothetical protein